MEPHSEVGVVRNVADDVEPETRPIHEPVPLDVGEGAVVLRQRELQEGAGGMKQQSPLICDETHQNPGARRLEPHGVQVVHGERGENVE